MRARTRRAFTLIEILIVIALSAILFTLLLIPLVNGIKYARQAQSLTAAQDAARITRERIERELGSAVYVFDNTSHPFLLTASANNASPTFQPGDDRFTNFLDLEIPQSGTNVNGGPNSIVAHAYNAKLDFVLPRLNSNGNPIDPTTQEPIRVTTSGTTSSPIISDPSQIFPAAAGTTMIRYWVGLKNPTQPYNNNREEKTNVAADNTYVLYRAQFRLTNDIDPATGKPKKNIGPGTSGDGTTINEKLFVPKHDAQGNVLNEPELDDPDFFRYVASSDVNWLDTQHGAYATAGAVASEHARVDTWFSIAKPVIPGPNVDLILLPHSSDGSLVYDAGAAGPCTATGCPGTAHSGIAHDPVPANGLYYPIVNTSVTFRPGVVSGDATPASTTDYSSQGVVAGTDQNDFAYVPTIYNANNQSWAQPYVVTLAPPSAPSGQTAGTTTYYVQQDPVSGDYYEYLGSSPNGTAVFDVTTGMAATGVTSYVPLSINAGTGTINFSTAALPDPANRYNRLWVYAPASTTLDLKATDTNGKAPPLGTIVDPQYTDDAGNPIRTARIVPGSLRVYGPDDSSGPGRGQSILYTEVSNLATPGDDQYVVDYKNSLLTLTGNDATATFNGSATMSVSYDYQANVVPVGVQVKAPSGTNPPANGTMQAAAPGITLLPMAVQVNYQTRDLIDVAIGVRIYNISTGRAEVIPAETKIKVGNSNR